LTLRISNSRHNRTRRHDTTQKPGQTTADKGGRLLFLYDLIVAIREVTHAAHFGGVCAGSISAPRGRAQRVKAAPDRQRFLKAKCRY
jgi:hypothetical protein